MKLIRSINRMSEHCKGLKRRGIRIGFVPTMGALHEGHLSLMRRSKKENDVSVISIFVNPTQFGRSEDFKEYPRDLKRDLRLAKEAGVDIVFHPDARAVYPAGYKTYVEVEGLSDVLCGKFRPGHFRGVATIVTKLFNIVMPDVAYFGQKDAQQAIIIQRLVKDLNLPIKIKVLPIIRESDGLAMSSRNAYLNSRQRARATVLWRALKAAKEMILSGEDRVKVITRRMRQLIYRERDVRIDYISVVDPYDLSEVRGNIRGRVLIALAVWIGKTRLIDNIVVDSR